MKCGKKNYRNKIHKKYLIPRGQKNSRTNKKTTQLCICNKKRKQGKEDTKSKQEELNKLINELKNLIEILKTITKVTIKEHICESHNQNQEKNPKQRKEKVQTKQKTLMNKPIPLSNRFSPMDIDPVETIIDYSDETTTYLKTDTIKLQKRLHKKINTKDSATENETTNPTKKKKK